MKLTISNAYKDTELREQYGMKATKTFTVKLSALYIEDEFNVREELDSEHISGIAEAYRNGLPVPPPVVQVTERGLKVIDGHHRYCAALEAKVERLEVKSFDGDEAEAVKLMVVSSQGKNLNPVERAKAYQRLIDQGLSQDAIAKQLGRSKKDVSNHLTLIQASPRIVEAVRTGQLGYAAAVEELNRNPESGEQKIESKLESGEKVTRSSLAGFTTKDYKRAMELLATMEIYDESLPQELRDLIVKYKEANGLL